MAAELMAPAPPDVPVIGTVSVSSRYEEAAERLRATSRALAAPRETEEERDARMRGKQRAIAERLFGKDGMMKL